MRDPGEGAIEYAKEQVVGLTQEQARVVIRKLLDAQPEDPRVKKCAHCGYLFRDKTKPGNAKVCGTSCKAATKTKQKRVQRAKGEIKPKKPLQYYFWFEYPFWISEKAMISKAWSHEKPYDSEKLAQIKAAKDTYNRIGGRRNVAKVIDTGGLNKKGVYTIVGGRSGAPRSWGRGVKWSEVKEYNLNEVKEPACII